MAIETNKNNITTATGSTVVAPSSPKPNTVNPDIPKPALIGFAVIAVLSLGFLGGWLGAESKQQQDNTSQASQAKQVILSESQLISDIAKKAGPSVVSIDVTTKSNQTDFLSYRRQPIQQRSAGTGFIISSDGVVVTNRHVIPKGATSISITLADGTELSNVELIGRTNDSDPLDVAFLKIKDKKGKTLKALKLGDSSKMQVGFKVVAIGNALGQFQNTVTEGIISGYGRSVQASDASTSTSETLEDLFQTDAAINPGNSGGPLVNTEGEVVGINTAIAGDAQNIGFAIPINNVMGLINSVLKQGKLLRPYLGVRYISLTDDVAAQLNLSIKRGAYIVTGSTEAPAIIADSPAQKAGLREKDIITKVNNTNVDEVHSLTSVLGKFSVGDRVTLTIVRDSKTMTVKATLAAAPTS